MLKRWIRRLLDERKFKCHRPYMRTHDDKPDYIEVLDMRVTGCSLNWAARLTRTVRFKYKCGKCGETFFIGGMGLFDDEKRHPEAYNDKGRPIDEEGNELVISQLG